MHDTQQLTIEYRSIAIDYGLSSLEGNYKLTNKSYDKLKKIYTHFLKQPEKALVFFASLLEDENHMVRLCAAGHCLGLKIYVPQAEKVLSDLTLRKDINILRLDAEMTLKVWRENGELKF